MTEIVECMSLHLPEEGEGVDLRQIKEEVDTFKREVLTAITTVSKMKPVF